MSKKWVQRISFRVHQWLGLASAAVLLVVGLTGGLLAFEDQIVGAWPTPKVTPQAQIMAPAQLLPALALPGKKLERIYLEEAADEPGRALYSDPTSKQREWQTFNPYTGELLGARPAITEFFGTVMALHRWLLMPNSIGSLFTGTACIMSIIFLIAGIIRRAPDNWRNVKDWLVWKKGSSGRHLLWQWHALLGTWLFIPIFIMALTGPWFAFDWYRDGVRSMLETSAPKPNLALKSSSAEVDLDAAWQTMQSIIPNGHFARLYLPRKPGDALNIRYLDNDAPHHHAFSAVSLDLSTGKVLAQQRYADLSGGDYILANIYAFHTGLYFGLPGRIIWSLGALAFGSFAVTGVWLFFNRRARPKEAVSGAADTLIAYASQSGTAAAYGKRLQAWFAQQEHNAHLRCVSKIEPDELVQYRQVVLLASTYGEGQPPDTALQFQQRLAEANTVLQNVQVAVLAFGDSQYQQFCAFGHWLAERFNALGAATLLPLTEVDRGAEQTIQQWNQALAQQLSLNVAELDSGFSSATVVSARCLNEDTTREVYDVVLHLADNWQPGDLVELMPYATEAQCRAHLNLIGFSGDELVTTYGEPMPLWQVQSLYKEFGAAVEPLSVEDYLANTADLALRSYSIASTDNNQQLRLMVRKVVLDNGLFGRGSGLLASVEAGDKLQLRIKPHSAFQLPEDDVPLVLLGAGTGLAPYLSFLAARADKGFSSPVWLLFGERYAELDNYYADELQRHLANGTLTELDYAWSRSHQPEYQGKYVQQLLHEHSERLQQYLADGAHLYVCGSIDGIGAGVQLALQQLLGDNALTALQQQQRYHRDLY
ncbi:PepSY domain-containing protein [Shewanella sp. C32]|uniref:NADPH--hemoprotein reductase n=1 Tax=Shewanella electrica TaxID=515560 RepID=A0ABT2FJ33_9GAMM|nr:PepSY domain-containing protein [Shewanella electrica]MCH1924446.1 PepSY domain-containing protein [Shewanella electrica]MCS4556347.1 PepSY domain-containing protein [Shewanella electrica]